MYSNPYAGYGMAAGILVVYWIIALVLAALIIVSLWRLFVKAGKPGWAAIVPFYNYFVLFEITFGKGIKFLLLLIPIYNIVVAIQMCIRLAKAFGKTGGYAAGLIFLPVVFMPMLAFGDSTYLGIPQ